MVKNIHISFNQEETNALQKILSRYMIFIKTHPEVKDDFQVQAVSGAFEKIDYEIHEVANWCDQGKECSYYVRHPKGKTKLHA